MDWLSNWPLLLVFGGIGFWVATFIVAAVIAPCVILDRRKYTGRIATIALLAYLAALALMGGPNVFKFALQYWYLLPVAVPVYLAAGWANGIHFQWRLRVTEEGARLAEEIRKFLRARKIEGDAIPPEQAEEWQRHLSRVDPPIDIKPEPDNYKYDIYFWIGFWPLSFTWTVLKDPLARAVKYIYRASYEQMKKMSSDAFANVEKNLPPAPPTPPPGAPRNPNNPPDDSLPPSSYLHGKPEKERTHSRPAASGSGEFMISR